MKIAESQHSALFCLWYTDGGMKITIKPRNSVSEAKAKGVILDAGGVAALREFLRDPYSSQGVKT